MRSLAKRLSFFLLLTAASLAAATPRPQQFSIHLTDANPTDRATLLLQDAAGNLFTVSSIQTQSSSHIRLAKLDPSGNLLAAFTFGGSSYDTPYAAALDPQGNIVVAGFTGSADFPLVHPLQTTGSGFVAKIDAGLTKLLYSTLLGVAPGPAYAGTRVTATTIDANGNIFLAGETEPGFPVTPNALQTQSPTVSRNGTIINGFIAELSAAGDGLIFSTLYSGGGFTCDGPCAVSIGLVFAPQVFTIPQSMALDRSGNVVIAGSTDANNLLLGPRAYATQCGCTTENSVGFMAKISADGTQLLAATYLPAQNVSINAMALDSAGNVLLGGVTQGGFPVTPNALQPTFPLGSAPKSAPTAGFLAELNPTGTALNFATYLGGNTVGSGVSAPVSNGPAALAFGDDGTIWVTGTSAVAALPASAGTALLGQSYVAGISPGGNRLVSLFTAPDGAAGAGLVITPQANLATLGATGSLLISSPEPAPYLAGLVELGAYQTARAICAREWISFYGVNIGPAIGQNAQTASGTIPRSLGGTQVLFDGVPAALLYAGPNQINAIVPSALAFAQSTNIQIVSPTAAIDLPAVPVQTTLPSVFSDISGNALALNQDGTVNTATNPAAPGSIVSIFVVGGGAASTTTIDNLINPDLSDAQFPTSVLSNAGDYGATPVSLEILYAGDAPDLPSGMIQINFRLPDQGSSIYQVQIGSVTSNLFLIH